MTDDHPTDESERAAAARSEAAELVAAKPELLVAGAFAGAFLFARALKRITA